MALPGPGPKCEAQSVHVISDWRGRRELGLPGLLMAECCCVSHSALWCPFADGFDVSESLEVFDKWSLWSPAEKLRKWWEMMDCCVGGQRAKEAECQVLLRKLWCAGQTPVSMKDLLSPLRLPGGLSRRQLSLRKPCLLLNSMQLWGTWKLLAPTGCHSHLHLHFPTNPKPS